MAHSIYIRRGQEKVGRNGNLTGGVARSRPKEWFERERGGGAKARGLVRGL